MAYGLEGLAEGTMAPVEKGAGACIPYAAGVGYDALFIMPPTPPVIVGGGIIIPEPIGTGGGTPAVAGVFITG
jgi:hypothetical protein